MSFLVRRWGRLVALAVGLVRGLLTTAHAWTPGENSRGGNALWPFCCVCAVGSLSLCL